MPIHHITLNIPEKVLLAEKTDAASFGREMRTLAAAKRDHGRVPSNLA